MNLRVLKTALIVKEAQGVYIYPVLLDTMEQTVKFHVTVATLTSVIRLQAAATLDIGEPTVNICVQLTV